MSTRFAGRFKAQPALTRPDDVSARLLYHPIMSDTPRRHLERHARHILLKEIGGPGLAKLSAAQVTLVGAGGIGGPCAQYLAAAGVGDIEIFDGDRVELSNLQRQVHFDEGDLGANKAEALARRLSRLNSDIRVTGRPAMFARGPPARGSILIDGTDRFEARFDINAAAADQGASLVSGAAIGWVGQVSVFTPAPGRAGPCYRCFVPDLPPEAEDCTRQGVVGPVVGIVGARLALETVKLITGAGLAGVGRLWSFDGLSGDARTSRLSRDPGCPHCH
ncbi:MAG: HesA/MoeB/ThiF family protein [Pseudomonadota bacterium]